eukprot:Hpha_TRINITY_DN16209_c1_g7::TRINITY_DN16209_c1_g7_i2::g.13950::m.13950
MVDRVRVTSLEIEGYFTMKHFALRDKAGAELPFAAWFWSDMGASGSAEFDPVQNAALEYAFHSPSSLPNKHKGFETDQHTYDFTEMTRVDRKGGGDGKKNVRLIRKAAQLRSSSAAFGSSVMSAHATPRDRYAWVCKVCGEKVKKMDRPPNGKGESWLCAQPELWLLGDDEGTRHPIESESLRVALSEKFREGAAKIGDRNLYETSEHVYDLDQFTQMHKVDRTKVKLYCEPICTKGKWGCGAREVGFGCPTIDQCVKTWMEKWPELPPPVTKQKIGSKAGWSLAYCDECFARATGTWTALSTRSGEWIQLQLPRAKAACSVEVLFAAPCLKSKLGGNIPRRVRVEAWNGTRPVFKGEAEPDGPILKMDFR